MEDTEALPNYPYRDDALLIFEVIHDYVREVLEAFYGTLRNWVLNLLAMRTENENRCHTQIHISFPNLLVYVQYSPLGALHNFFALLERTQSVQMFLMSGQTAMLNFRNSCNLKAVLKLFFVGTFGTSSS